MFNLSSSILFVPLRGKPFGYICLVIHHGEKFKKNLKFGTFYFFVVV